MFNKRLSELAPGAMPFVVRAVVFKWIGLLATIVLMLVLGNAFQRVFDGGLANLDATSLGLIALAVCVRAVTSVLAANAGDRAALRAREQVRMAVYDKLLRLGPSYATSVSTSEAVQLSIEGAEQLQVYFGSFLPQLFFAALAPLTLFVVMLPLCWPAALVLLACVPLIPLLIMMVRRAAKAAADVYWGSYTDLGALFLEDIQGLTTLKIFRADAARHERMNDKAEKFRNATMQMLFVQLRSILAMDLVVFLGAAAGIVVAVVQLASGAIPFSTAFAIVFLSQEFFLPMRTLGSLFHAAMNGIAASKRMIELIDLQEPQRCEGTERPAGCTIECAGIGFTYDGHRQALENVSARFEQGAFTGIVGASGSGKSTLAAILSGTLAGYVGSVRIGGVDVRDIELDDLSRLITTVPTNGYLFKGTLRSNLALGNPSASDDEMLSALQRCKVLDFALASGGLDMPVSEGGQNLSGGQRQRICIARALLHDTPVYVFDEATSNIDVESERAIGAVIRQLAEERTVICISHRLSLVESADSILVLDAGSVVEQGTHAQLLAQGGHYARLCESQMRLERIAGAYDARDAAREASEAPDARGSAEAYGTDEASEMPDAISSRLASATAACEREAAAVVSEGAAAAGAFAGSAQSVGTSGVGDSHVGDALDSAGVTGAVQAPRKRSGLSIMKDMLALLGSLRPHMILAITLGVVGFLAGIFLTTFGAYGMLDGIGRPAGIALVLACVLVFACGAVRGPLRYGEQLTNHFIAFKLLAVIRDRIYGALRRLAPAKLEGRDKGDLVSLVTSDIELLEVFYAHTISPVAIAIIVSVVMVVYFLVHSLVLALVAVVGYVLVGIVFPLIASRLSGAAGLRLREGAADLNSSVLESLRGLRELLQFGGAEQRAELVRSQTRSLDVDELALKRTSAVVSAVCDVVIVALDVAMIVLSLFLVGEGGLSLQAAFVCSAAFMASFGAVVAIMRLGTGLQPTLASGQRVLELLGEQPVVADVVDGADVAFAGAAACDASFSYAGEVVVQGANMVVPAGAVVSLEGKSGSGKSTMLKLFMRFWDVQEGRIEVSKEDVRHVNTTCLRSLQGYMTQETHLFDGTVLENLLIALPEATEGQVRDALARAQILDLVDSLPQGLDTAVGELGDTLSGGERQRLGLARIFLQDAPCILLDEPTSNLDALSEAAVMDALMGVREGKTMVLVSHRPSTTQFADIRYSMDRDRVS